MPALQSLHAAVYLFLHLLLPSLMDIAAAQDVPRIQFSHTTESLRGVSAVSRQVAWASGTHGTYLRTLDGGRTWTPAQVPDAGALDFRAVVAFSADEAFLMSAGPGDQSRIYLHQRWRKALAPAVHQHKSQRIFRLHGVLGFEAWSRAGRSDSR